VKTGRRIYDTYNYPSVGRLRGWVLEPEVVRPFTNDGPGPRQIGGNGESTVPGNETMQRMRMNKTKVISGLLVLATVVVALGLLVGGVSSASPSLAAAGPGNVAREPGANTSKNYSFSQNAPTWNTGNLCTPVTNGSSVTCTYGASHGGHGFVSTQGGSGGCGCQSNALTYNFSGNNTNYVVKISNTQNQLVFLNFKGSNDTFLVVVTGCSGGKLNITVMSQTTFTLDVSASSVKVWIQLYSDADHYIANLSGSHATVWTYFVSARPKYNECPSSNNTKSDSYLLNVTGKDVFQGLVFVNGVNYTTASNTIWTGNWNSVSFENTTNFECSWSTAPAPTCHHGGWSPALDGAAGRVEE
jgi:hypothetical protein